MDDNVLCGLEQALGSAIAGMKPAEFVPDRAEDGRFLYFKDENTDERWKDLLKRYLEMASTFEIHCWNEEPGCIELALRYGELKEDGWVYGRKITGPVTPEFEQMLLDMPKPTDTELENKQTPFFNIILDSGFSSSHYGTEVHLSSEA